MDLKNLITEAEARDQLRLPEHTLRRLRRLGRGPTFTRLGHRILYRVEDLDAWVRANTTIPDNIIPDHNQNKENHHA